LNTAYPLLSDTAYAVFCPIQRIHPNRLIRRIHFHWIRRIDRLRTEAEIFDFLAKVLPFSETNSTDSLSLVLGSA
ncbi:hypothetical protein Tco_0063111, partial [Tanacetum coccineum]